MEPGRVKDGQFLDMGLSGPLRGIPDYLTGKDGAEGQEEKDSVCPCPLEPSCIVLRLGDWVPLPATVFFCWKLRMINLEMAFQDIM